MRRSSQTHKTKRKPVRNELLTERRGWRERGSEPAKERNFRERVRGCCCLLLVAEEVKEGWKRGRFRQFW